VLICGQFLNLINDRIVMKKVFLTGASSGIGLAIAQALVACGHEVWGTSRDPTRLPQLARLHSVRLDLADSISIDTAFNSALGEAGHFDILINNAGSGHFGPTETLSTDEVSREFQILVFGHLRLTQLALKTMHARGSGLIINITSLAARLPVPFMAAYNAAKAAMAAFTMSIQLELPDPRVRIVDLQPADICTPFNESVRKDPAGDPRHAVRAAKTWSVVERNMAAAPKPELVARRVLELIDKTNLPPLVTVGGFFQAKIAPLILRFLPQRVQIWGLKKYYGI
jgi:NAD(P)-dependent dehydrogenase (short-subunit alcohol dehydrogenase family)